MVSELPYKVRMQVMKKLYVGNFSSAKAIHDHWMAEHMPHKYDPNNSYFALSL
jgi:hypothetical protein